MLTLDYYLLSCGGGGRVSDGDGSGGVGGGKVGGGGGDSGNGSDYGGDERVGGGGSSGNGSGCQWLWLLFIVIDILFYCDVYIILLCWKLK